MSEDDRESFWKTTGSFTKIDWKNHAIANQAAGYHNSVFAPSDNGVDVFCVWECADAGVTVADFEAYVEGKFIFIHIWAI